MWIEWVLSPTIDLRRQVDGSIVLIIIRLERLQDTSRRSLRPQVLQQFLDWLQTGIFIKWTHFPETLRHRNKVGASGIEGRTAGGIEDGVEPLLRLREALVLAQASGDQ